MSTQAWDERPYNAEGRLRRVEQDILAGNPEGRMGNCLQAAVATMLGQDLFEVPHFVEPETVALDNGWWLMVVGYLHVHGYELVQVRADELVAEAIAGHPRTGVFLVGGRSPRGVAHVVVWHDGDQLDPHPSQDGLTTVTEAHQLVRFREVDR